MAPTRNVCSNAAVTTMTPPQPGGAQRWLPITRTPLVSLSNSNSFGVLQNLESDLGEKVKDHIGTAQPIDPLIGGTLPSHCSRDEKEKLTLALSTIIDYCALFGFKSSGFDRRPTLRHWQLCSVKCGWIKFLKYKLAAFFSDFLQVELPPKPFDVEDHSMHLVGGRCGRFIHQLLKTDRALSFATGILYSKKGMPRPDEQMLAAALIATKKVLTTLRPVPVSAILVSDLTSWESETRPLSLIDMGDEVERTCMEVFRGYKLSEEDLHREFAPSVKATYTSSRSKLGTFGDLVESGLITDLPVSSKSWSQIGPKHRLMQDPFSKLYSDAFVSSKVEDERIEDEFVVHKTISEEFRDLVNSRYSSLYENVRQRASVEVADVKLVALPEALKIRVISKGPTLTYFTLKPLQKFLHRIMRKQRMFALIGETVSEKFLNDLFLPFTGQFHSLDYSSATDFLNPYLSERAANAICTVVDAPDDIRILFLKALTGHTVEGEKQVWGQLMGSVISFIILCLVNAAVIRKSLELLHQKEFSLREIPATVNGDDGAVRAPAEYLPIWKDVASLCGLEPSIGKVYSHDTYLNINSTSFVLRDGSLSLVPYVNLGLVKGMTRSGGVNKGVKVISDEIDSRLGSLGSRHHQLMESCPKDLRLAVHKMFIKEHFDLLKSVRLPWFVPEELGGVGLKPFIVWTYGDNVEDASWQYLECDGVRYGPSDQDLEIMEILRTRTFRSVSTRKLPTAQPIQVRSVWFSRKGFDIPRSREGDSVDLQISDSDIGFMDVSTYYLSPSLVSKQLISKSQEILRSNERAWSYLSALTSQGFSLE
jgi:hypothetical protein